MIFMSLRSQTNMFKILVGNPPQEPSEQDACSAKAETNSHRHAVSRFHVLATLARVD